MEYKNITKIEALEGSKRVIEVLTLLAQNGGNVFRGYNKQDVFIRWK